MKIKKIASLCSRGTGFFLKNKTDREGVVTQWLGDGGAFYPLLGAPVLDEDSLCTMLDITGKKRESTIVRCDEMPEGINVDDISDMDLRLEQEELSICFCGITVLPLRGQNDIICIQAKYLEPLDDEKKLLELYSRTEGEMTYVVAKAGMMIRGIIMPYQVEEEMADRLSDIARECKEKTAGREQ